jgi:hypothetical protein
MELKNIKKEYKAFVDHECKIHVDKPAGKENCAHIIMGSQVSICTMLSSLFEALVKHGALDFNDLRDIVDIAEQVGAKNESK